MCFCFVDIKASGIVFCLFFFSYVFCLINSIFFTSKDFYFIILSRNFLSVIAVINFDISNSSAEIALKLHSFRFQLTVSKIHLAFLFRSVLPRRNLFGKCFRSHSPKEVFLFCFFLSSPPGLCYFFTFQ